MDYAYSYIQDSGVTTEDKYPYLGAKVFSLWRTVEDKGICGPEG